MQIATGVTVAFLISWILTPPIIALAWKIGAVDVPTDWRRMHRDSVPRAGGIAVFASFAVTCLLFTQRSANLTYALCGGAVIFAIGFADDLYRLPVWVKFPVQIFAATGAVLGVNEIPDQMVLPAIVWIVALTNAHNFIDGLDGLLAGSGAIEGIALCLLLLTFGRPADAFPPLLLTFALLGFRYYNRSPAQIFSGDCGSGTVGFLLGMLSFPAFLSAGWEIGRLAPFLIFAYPLTDLITAVARRILRGKSPFAADRGHLHHRICATGLSQKKSAGVLLWLSVATGTVGVFLGTESFWWEAVLSCLATVGLMILLRRRILSQAQLDPGAEQGIKIHTPFTTK